MNDKDPTEISERIKLSHEAARDTVKHLVTLSTASVGLLIAIFKDLIHVDGPSDAPSTLWWSFLLFGTSILAGLLALQSLAGNLEKQASPTIYQRNVVVFVLPQLLFFVGALILAGFSVALR